MIISGSGLSSKLYLKLADATRAKQLTSIRNEAQFKREIQNFRDTAASIKTPADFVKNYDAYSVVMRAYDLESQMFGKAMIRKILESNPSDTTSLVNRLTDSRFKDLHAALGFTNASGPTTPTLADPAVQDKIVDKLVNQVFINRSTGENAAVGTVYKFRDKVSSITNWYSVLKDKDLVQFFQTALALPSSISGLDISKQNDILKQKYDLTKLSDPAEREKLINRYLVLSDAANNSQSAASNAIVQMMQPLSSDGNFVPQTLDIPAINFSAASLYK